MNTQTHLMIACTLFAQALPPLNDNQSQLSARRQRRRHSQHINISVVFGALFPDLSIFVFFLWAQIFTTTNFATIWGELYWTEPWQTFSAISNSIPLVLCILIAGVYKKSKPVTAFALAALTHIAFDLPFHADDAHKHFWPILDIRLQSPLSYWDVNHHARWVSLFETGLLIVCAAIIIKRFHSKIVKILAAIPALAHTLIQAALFLK